MVDSSPFTWGSALCKSGPPVYVQRIHPYHENYVINKHYRACVNNIYWTAPALLKAVQNKGRNEAARAVATHTNTKKPRLGIEYKWNY